MSHLNQMSSDALSYHAQNEDRYGAKNAVETHQSEPYWSAIEDLINQSEEVGCRQDYTELSATL